MIVTDIGWALPLPLQEAWGWYRVWSTTLSQVIAGATNALGGRTNKEPVIARPVAPTRERATPLRHLRVVDSPTQAACGKRLDATPVSRARGRQCMRPRTHFHVQEYAALLS